MHCVLCGIALTNENGAGLVCKGCKPDLRGKKATWEQVIVVAYCCRCGRPYQPVDASVGHRFCFSREMMTGVDGDRKREGNDAL